jgi:hypothetical protein
MIEAQIAKAEVVYSSVGNDYTQTYNPYDSEDVAISFLIASSLRDNFSG